MSAIKKRSNREIYVKGLWPLDDPSKPHISIINGAWGLYKTFMNLELDRSAQKFVNRLNEERGKSG